MDNISSREDLLSSVVMQVGGKGDRKLFWTKTIGREEDLRVRTFMSYNSLSIRLPRETTMVGRIIGEKVRLVVGLVRVRGDLETTYNKISPHAFSFRLGALQYVSYDAKARSEF